MAGVIIKKDDLKAGDHIYSSRLGYAYSHHGIYTGDGKVIHFTRGAGQEIGTGTVLDRYIFSSSSAQTSNSPCPQCGDQSNLDGVICSCLECFLSGGDLYRFEYSVSPFFFLAKARGGTCTLAPSDPPEDVLHRAEYLLEKGFGGYNLLKNNCEDFAIYCKTGLAGFTNKSVGRSGQVNAYVGMAVALSGLAGYGYLFIKRYSSDIGVRHDVTKIPVERLFARASLVEAERESVAEIAQED